MAVDRLLKAVAVVFSLSAVPGLLGAADVFWEVAVPSTDLRRAPASKDPSLPTAAIDPLEETQLLSGEKVKVLEEKDGWVRVEAVEQPHFGALGRWTGYPGWVKKKDLRPSSIAPAAVAAAAVPGDDGLRSRIIASAREYLGTPYYWGGRTAGKSARSGVDCSGLVDLAYRKNGVVLPRNADDQYRRCRPLPLDRLRPGDLVFFSRSPDPSKIIHVLLFTGGDGVLEATGKYHKVVEGTLAARVGKPLKSLRAGEKAGDYYVYGGSVFAEDHEARAR